MTFISKAHIGTTTLRMKQENKGRSKPLGLPGVREADEEPVRIWSSMSFSPKDALGSPVPTQVGLLEQLVQPSARPESRREPAFWASQAQTFENGVFLQSSFKCKQPLLENCASGYVKGKKEQLAD